MSWPERVPLRAVLAVAGDRAVDDPRVHLSHPLVADAEPVEHAGPEGLEHDVVLAHERQQRLAARARSSGRGGSSACCGSATGTAPSGRSRGRPRNREATSGCSRPSPCPRPSARRRRSPPAAASRSRRAAAARGRGRGTPSSGRLMPLSGSRWQTIVPGIAHASGSATVSSRAGGPRLRSSAGPSRSARRWTSPSRRSGR